MEGYPAPGDRWLPTGMRPHVAKSLSLSFFKDNLEIWMIYLESPNYLKIIKIACGLDSAWSGPFSELSGSGKNSK